MLVYRVSVSSIFAYGAVDDLGLVMFGRKDRRSESEYSKHNVAATHSRRGNFFLAAHSLRTFCRCVRCLRKQSKFYLFILNYLKECFDVCRISRRDDGSDRGEREKLMRGANG